MDNQLKAAGEEMHASLKAAGFTLDFKDLLKRLEAAGIPDASTALQKIVDQAIFPWLEASLTNGAKSNIMMAFGVPVLTALQLAVDAQMTPFLQSLQGQ